jgi:predicted Zn-dependent peptidase
MSQKSKERKYKIGIIQELSDFKQEGKTPNRRIIIDGTKYYFYEESDRNIQISEFDEISFLYYENDNKFNVGTNLSFPAKSLDELLKVLEEKKKNKFSKTSQETLDEIKQLNKRIDSFSESFNQIFLNILSEFKKLNESLSKISGVLK